MKTMYLISSKRRPINRSNRNEKNGWKITSCREGNIVTVLVFFSLFFTIISRM